MLLESLIGQFKAEKGTPGTPDENWGVPDSDTLKTAPIKDIGKTEHQEHQEHPKIENPVLTELFRVYEAIGQHYTKEHWKRLASLPGWKPKLDELEQAFTAAWKEGRDCWQEFEGLRDHWRAGLRAIKEPRAGDEDKETVC